MEEFLLRVRGISSRLLSKGNLIAVGGTLLTLFFAYVFHFLMTRVLSTSEYGDLSILIGAALVLTVPVASISSAITREIAKLDRDKKEGRINFMLYKYLRSVSFLGLGIGFLFAIAAQFLYNSDELKFAAVLIAFSIPLNYAAGVISGYLQGKEKITAFVAGSLGNAVVKILFALAFIAFGWGVAGASGAFTLSWVVVVGGMFMYVRRYLRKQEPFKIDLSKSFTILMFTGFLLTLFSYMDLFFVKLFLGSEDAGFYNVAGVTAKVLLFMVSGILLFFLPKSSKLSYRESGKIRNLLLSALFFLLPVFIVLLFFPEQLIRFFYTEKYASAVAPFTILAFGSLMIALTHVLFNLMWSQRDEKVPFVFMASAVILDAVLLYVLVPHYGLMGAAIATTVSAFAALAASSAYVYLKVRGAV